MKKTLFIVCIFCFSAFNLSAAKKTPIISQNSIMRQTVIFEDGRLYLSSVFDLKRNIELLNTSETKPYFEFYINKQTLSSDMPVWNLKRQTCQDLSNGGTETYILLQANGIWKGLEVEIRRQHFPQSTLIREQLKLRNTGQKDFFLNKKEGKLFFRFPQYALNSTDSETSLQEIRMATYGKDPILRQNENDTYNSSRKYRNLADCHMFHPDTILYTLKSNERLNLKGPFSLAKAQNHYIMMTYEHASQDRVTGFYQNDNDAQNQEMIDASQGTKGDWNKGMTNDDFKFIGIAHEKSNNTLVMYPEMLRGGYLDGEKIPSNGYYETVWSSFSFIDSPNDLKANIYNYLLNEITVSKPARSPKFYYNTWGLQRDSQSEKKDMREIFTEARILEEINYAAEMNVDLFILDDGWQEKHGVWEYNKKRLPNGLKPLIDRIKSKNMIPGIWLSLAGIDSTSTRYKQHPEWVIKDANDAPLIAQWDHPVFDYVSDFSKVILEDHKRLIDQGILYFKWDAVNTFNSALKGLYHGDKSYSDKEVIDRYNYLLPFYITETMRKLREYNENVIVEIDLTEPERCLVGLMPLQEGKFFWMNNGASGYGDYSTFRTKSMRTVINEFSPFFPPEIFTYATYPHNVAPYYAQRYNVNTSIVSGHGFWGNLRRTQKSDRESVAKSLSKAKRVLPYIAGNPLEVEGKIGSSPEIYRQIDYKSGFGQVIGFSGSALYYPMQISVEKNVLGVLNHAYKQTDGKLHLNFQFQFSDDTREAFILGNEGSDIRILESTGWLNDINLTESNLTLEAGSETTVTIFIPSKYNLSDFKNNLSGKDQYTFKLSCGQTLNIPLGKK